MRKTDSFHAHHSPMGAHASFTLGMFGSNGGMALEKGKPAEQSVFIGYRTDSGVTKQFPFYKELVNEADRFSLDENSQGVKTISFEESQIQRSYDWAIDKFSAPGIDFSIITPFFEISDPAIENEEALKKASCPSIFGQITIRNDSNEDWEGFFAIQGDTPWTPLSSRNDLKGMISRDELGFASDDPEVSEFIDFGIETALSKEHKTPNFLLGPIGGISFKVAAGTSKTVRIALGFFKSGNVTINKEAKYWYTNYFDSIETVLSFALEGFNEYLDSALDSNQKLKSSGLSLDQQFLIAHSTRSYYGSTQWLSEKNKARWIVNEGEYLMINTLDLTIDMAFFELEYNPWTLRNVLEQFAKEYSYVDQVFSPDCKDEMHEGGISFCHDMGVANHFSPNQYSCYECAGIDRKCFSYMTYEELTNWVICSGLYYSKTSDQDFLNTNASLFSACLNSLLNRDNPNPELRNGLMGFDSSRTLGGGEITTYDSLDHSLGQARNNVYLAGKTWASYLTLELLFNALGKSDLAENALASAKLTAATLSSSFDDSLGFIPAVLEDGNQSAIIPAIEALIYPYMMGQRGYLDLDGPFAEYLAMLKRHTEYVLKKGVCLYEDGGWKLSSSADNSWMSKICLNQFIVHEIFGINYGGELEADNAHVEWQVNGSKSQACSDQFASGKPIGSLYYPRIVTSILWLKAKAKAFNTNKVKSEELAKT